MSGKIPPVAECIRNVSSWSHVSPQHKLDSLRFDPTEFKKLLPIASPKLDALFQKIKELDENDKEKYGHTFKHLIYTDVKGSYGAKIIAAGFKVKGYPMAFDESFKIHEKHSKDQFALLCSSQLYGKPVGVRFRKQLLSLMNARPENIYGEKIRFLILDQGYKEGIDVFDIKYVHLFEPLMTSADEKQVVGRGTRFCGQLGLPFDKKQGWPLYVFRYDLTIPEELQTKYESTTAFDYFLSNTNLNLQSLVLAAELETYCKEGAIDAELTEAIHKFTLPGQTSHRTTVILPPKPDMDSPSPVSPPKRFIQQYGKVFDTSKPIICVKGCAGNVTPIPTPLMLMAYLVSYPTATYYMHTENVRPLLCRELPKKSLFCKNLTDIWKHPDAFFEDHKEILKTFLENKDLLPIHRRTFKSFIKYFRTVRSKKQDTLTSPETFWGARYFIKKQFKEYKWPAIEIQNGCEKPKEDQKPSAIVSFTPTQNFIRKYFSPELTYKGILAYHSVGSGKTCTAIATASTQFESQGYTIVWVTRHTLKEDVWKNMFDQVCDLVLQEKVERGLKIPKDRSARLKLLSKQWLMPMSYKQFANMLEGRNEFYHKLVERNGKEDPLRKTFVVIDEVHKLYAPDLKAQERPNVDKLKTLIHNSYTTSKKDSVRLLLMTATPILDNPMSLIKILNFLRLPDQQLTENLDEFMKEYCDGNGHFTEQGSERFLNQIVGQISYLNRSEDIRQFAYPVFENVLVPLSTSQIQNPTSETQILEQQIKECPPKDKKCASALKKKIKDLTREYKLATKTDPSQEKALEECLKK
jgi:superfamily II DNA or RNA helicase